jgi:hypothetical protein
LALLAMRGKTVTSEKLFQQTVFGWTRTVGWRT